MHRPSPIAIGEQLGGLRLKVRLTHPNDVTRLMYHFECECGAAYCCDAARVSQLRKKVRLQGFYPRCPTCNSQIRARETQARHDAVRQQNAHQIASSMLRRPEANPRRTDLKKRWLSMHHRLRSDRERMCHRERIYIGESLIPDSLIHVCDRWGMGLGIEGFDNFFADMGYCPEGKMLLRRNPYREYSPENCFWGTAQERTQLSWQGVRRSGSTTRVVYHAADGVIETLRLRNQIIPLPHALVEGRIWDPDIAPDNGVIYNTVHEAIEASRRFYDINFDDGDDPVVTLA